MNEKSNRKKARYLDMFIEELYDYYNNEGEFPHKLKNLLKLLISMFIVLSIGILYIVFCIIWKQEFMKFIIIIFALYASHMLAFTVMAILAIVVLSTFFQYLKRKLRNLWQKKNQLQRKKIILNMNY